jgi:hypothetical protein
MRKEYERESQLSKKKKKRKGGRDVKKTSRMEMGKHY